MIQTLVNWNWQLWHCFKLWFIC